MPPEKPAIRSLYYITHKNNLKSMLENGILSHALVEERQIEYTPIYDESSVSNRKDKKTPDGRSLWEFANLYFQARNPMLYRVLHEKNVDDLIVIGIQQRVLDTPDSFIANGNAASDASEIYPVAEGLKSITRIWNVIRSDWWNAVDGSKRKIMAEVLIPNSISPDLIDSVYVANHKTVQEIKETISSRRISVVPEPNMFFRPARHFEISDNIILADGDLFFSTMHTLTVSVNIVGIMGKGLASRAKYQFPDVYVIYQDACRRKSLRMGRPFLYKRESFVDEELADEPGTLPEPNAKKWFLLFATKRHWRDKSSLEGIETGLNWIRENYIKEGIQSLAIPALGCGLGRLEWRDVGPVMCRILTNLNIPVVIYLPRERKIDEKYLSRDYLLGG